MRMSIIRKAFLIFESTLVAHKIVEMAEEGLLSEVSTDILLTENKELGLSGVLFVVSSFCCFVEL